MPAKKEKDETPPATAPKKSKHLSPIAAMMEVQYKLKAPKTQENKFGGFMYRNCEDILQAAKPLCIENGLLLMVTDEVVVVGAHTYIKAIAEVASEVDGTVHFKCCGWARHPEQKKGMDDSQITGATSSYARKYALNGLFAIDDTKDADFAAPAPTVAPQRATAPVAKPASAAPALTVDQVFTKLGVCKTLANLKTVWDGLPVDLKSDPEVLAKKEEMKAKLA